MNVSKLTELKKNIVQILKHPSGDFPIVITFNRGIELPKYKITIEESEEDFFIDSKGVKWVKAKGTGKHHE